MSHGREVQRSRGGILTFTTVFLYVCRALLHPAYTCALSSSLFRGMHKYLFITHKPYISMNLYTFKSEQLSHRLKKAWGGGALTPQLIAITLTISILGTFGFLMALVSPLAAEAAESCTALTITSGGDTNTAGWTATNPVANPLSDAAYSGGSQSDAFATEAVIPPWVNPATAPTFVGSGALWVSSDDSWPGGTGNTEGAATTSQWRLFEHTFALPSGATVASATLWYAADNAAAVYVDGNATPIDYTGSMADVFGATTSAASHYDEVYMTNFDASAGTNTLNFVVRNWSTDASTNPTGLLYKAVVNYCVPVTPDDVTVTVLKYVDGMMATGSSTGNADFTMQSTWDADNIGTGTGSFVLNENNSPTPYKAVTATMTPGANYTVSETMNDTVGANCAAGKPFAFTGYSVGDSQSSAASATPTTTAPNLTNIMTDKTIIIWNEECDATTTPGTVMVSIHKFVEGMMATASSSNNLSFPLRSEWDATNIGTGTAQFTLNASTTMAYMATSAAMSLGADYQVKELVNGGTVGAQCANGKPYALLGYTTGNTYAEAASKTPTMSQPVFENLQSNKHVIVWNDDCSITNGELQVTSIDSVDTTAKANGSFADGWVYVFNITAPTNEPNLAMRFSDWLKNGGNGTIPVANNMRISSAQANNGGATILLTGSNIYSSPALHMTGDLSTTTVGRQVQITVEVAVPSGTPNGSYTTNYGVRSTP